MPLIKIGRRSALLLIEGAAVIVVLTFAVLAFIAWRLSVGPMDVGFARDYVQAALRDHDSGAYVTLGDLTLSWPDLTDHLLLHVKQAGVFDAAGSSLLSVNELDLTLSRSRLLIGQIAPVSIILNQPYLRVVRNAEGGIDVGLQKAEMFGPPHPDELDRQQMVADDIFNALTEGDDGGVFSPLSRLERVEAKAAVIQVEDQLLGSTWVLPASDIVLMHEEGRLSGTLDFLLPDRAGGESEVSATLSWPQDTKILALGLKAQRFPFSFLAQKIPALQAYGGEGITFDIDAKAEISPDLKLSAANAVLTSAGGDITVAAYSDTRPLSFKNLKLEVAYDAKENQAELISSSIQIGDVTVHAKAQLNIADTKIDGPVTITIDPLAHAAIAPIWPDRLKADSSHEWIVKKLSKGKLSDLKATMNLEAVKADATWSTDVKDLKAEFAFEAMDVNYRPPMLPVRNAKGRGAFILDEEKLSITVDSADIGNLKAGPAQLEFINIITPGAGKADLFVDIAGPLSGGFEYVMQEPIALKPKFKPADVKGQLSAEVSVQFPTHKNIKVEEVKVGLNGTLRDVVLPDVVRDLDLTGGPFDIKIEDEKFMLQGKGMLQQRQVALEYEEFLNSKGRPYASKVKADLSVDEDLRKQFGIDLSDFLSGPLAASIAYTELPDGRSSADVTADLTPARLFVDVGGYEKLPGVKGQAILNARFKDEILLDIPSLKVTAPGFLIDKAQLRFVQRQGKTELALGEAKQFVVGETTGAAEFTVDPSGQYIIALDTPLLDLRPLLNREKSDTSYSEPPMQVSVKANRVKAEGEQTIQNGRFYLDISTDGAFNELALDGVAGAGDFSLRFQPDAGGHRSFRMQADDAGAALRAFGVYDNIRGGTLLIEGQAPSPADRNITGTGEISDFRVVKAPTLGKLLSALSVPGMIRLLTNEGLTFTKMEADFEWLYRREGSFLALKNGRTSGNSVGLTFEGGIDNQAQTMDVKGTVVPLSEVNKIIGSIPIVGQILTGGTGSLIAATYTLKGPQKEPQVFVNPLSVLTPGLLRRILFEGN
jgi:hypothetical protein